MELAYNMEGKLRLSENRMRANRTSQEKNIQGDDDYRIKKAYLETLWEIRRRVENMTYCSYN